ncbi:MAG: tetratricopeptide repeat protein [Flavobacterium sp.]|uniref:tetratricopeptide repeat protein n=1 Tax=Flavobacterium sp. TaxID=239 RepID=UPI00120C7D14|nr:tetratricopeptide repeat protein [Flavobacterium sp.]RZJ65337.1 MAG: tetratricopeptide repeat protein [Flavobacterium sp.]
MKTIDKYLAQAMDCFPYDIEGTIESLDYALSYNDKSTMALCLYGRLMADQFQKYEEAKSYFSQALAADIHAWEVYPHYANVLIRNEDFEEAEKLIDFALTIKGADKFEMHLAKAHLFERQRKFDEAEKAVKEAKLHVVEDWQESNLESLVKRIKMKRDSLAGKKSAKKKSKKKAK